LPKAVRLKRSLAVGESAKKAIRIRKFVGLSSVTPWLSSGAAGFPRCRRYRRCRITQKRVEMHFGIYKSQWFCRWCGLTYKPLKDTDRDGFCSPACKQALHRALKKYLAWKLSRKKVHRNRKSGTRHRRNAKRRKTG